MSKPIIETKDLTKIYGDIRAVDHLNLTVDEGEIFGLLGPNGAGKTTTIILLMGLSVPTAGTATVVGHDIIRGSKEVRRSVGLLPEAAGYYEDLTAEKNLEYIGYLNDLTRIECEKRASELLEEVGLTDWSKVKVEKFSRGMKQRLGIAQALIKRPKLVIFDEPTIGLDPAGTKEIRDMILKLNREQGLTVMMSSHLLHEIQLTCTNVGILNKGKMIVEDTIENLARLFSEHQGMNLEFKLHNATPELYKEIEGIDGVTLVNQQNGVLNVGMKRDVTIEVSKVITKYGAEILLMKPREYSLEDIFMKYYEDGVR
jgi:ABC-2 type transport system ATP-binding protein